MLAPIEFVYFDLGNILVRFDNEIAIANVASASGVNADQVRAEIYDSGLQDEYEHGRFDGEAYAERARERLGVNSEELSTQQFLDGISAMFTPIDGMADLVRDVQKRLGRVGLLSNTCEAHWDWIQRQPWDVGDLDFDPLILSYEVGAMKPNEKIYRAAEEACGVAPDRILFLDDKMENIEAARERGWQAEQCFGGPEALRVISDMLD